ncbi:MAG: pyridoxal-dependent decarboxylase [Pseudomonadota bacterium]
MSDEDAGPSLADAFFAPEPAPRSPVAGGRADFDPEDWGAFRALAEQVAAACVDRIEGARELPWRPTPDLVKFELDEPAPTGGAPLEQVMGRVLSDIMPHATGNTHPRFFGWVHGTGLADGLLAAMVEAAMNSNCGGRDHAALYVERQVISWMCGLFGFGERASGVLVSGASMATLYALLAARRRAREVCGDEIAAERLTVYAAEGAHACVDKACDVLGLPARNLRKIPLTQGRRMSLRALRSMLARDRDAGFTPMAVVGTVGGVETGASDDLVKMAGIAKAEAVWLHVDGAFGAWARLARGPWRAQADGIDRADSLGFDFHKWPSVNYDCGCVLIRDGDLHRRTFSNRPNYLTSADDGLAGGDPWFCDYGLELSRSFRALKVWIALKTHGLERLGAVVDKCCRQARRMADRVQAARGLSLCFEPKLNVVCFRPDAPELSDAEADALVTRAAAAMQRAGEAVFSTARIDGRMALRAAIVNHRTRDADIDAAVAAAEAVCLRLRGLRGAT